MCLLNLNSDHSAQGMQSSEIESARLRYDVTLALKSVDWKVAPACSQGGNQQSAQKLSRDIKTPGGGPQGGVFPEGRSAQQNYPKVFFSG